MWRGLALLVLFTVPLLLSSYSAEGGEPQLCILAPKNGDNVPERPYVSGRVAKPDAKIWVIVHPMKASDYWVQPRTTVKEDGTWKVCVYIGRPGNVDIGRRFKIMAIANPKQKIKRGTVLSAWPDAQWKSNIVGVIRR